MIASTAPHKLLTPEVEALLSHEFQPFFNKSQDVKEPSDFKRERRSMGEVLHVLTLALLTENSARNWLEIRDFQFTNYSKLKAYIVNYGKPVVPGTFWTKLNCHLKMDVFAPSFISWTEAIAEATNHQVEPLTENEATTVRSLTSRQSWRVLGLLRFWINKNPEFKAVCRSYFNFTA